MHVSYSIPCTLNSLQARVVFRDICRTINYSSPDREIARETPHGLISERWSDPVQPFRTRVFCIGWPKTGTTSLTEVLRILGLFSWHWAPWVISYKHIRSEISEFRIDFSGIGDYTAVSDLPICALYRELDKGISGKLVYSSNSPS